MDKKYNSHTWVGNMYQRFEAVCQEVDDFVNKDKVKYVENHMQSVGKSVKKFYSDVVQDILPPFVDPVQHVAQAIPSKPIDLVETYTSSTVGIKGNTVDNNKNKSEEGPLVPTKKCHKSSITGLCHSEQISCATSGYPVGEADTDIYSQQEGDNLINKNLSEAFIYSGCIDEKCNDDLPAKIPHESSEDRLDNRYSEEEGILCNTSSEDDASVFEDADWGIENIVDLNLGINRKIEGEPSSSPSQDVNVSEHRILFAAPFVEEKSEKVRLETLVKGLGLSCSQEKRTLQNRSIDEYECDSNPSITHQSSAMESSIVYNENKEKACHILASGLVPTKLYDSSNLSFRNSPVKPDTIYRNPTESMGCLSLSSHGLSSSESSAALGCDNNNDSTRLASSSYVLSDDTTRSDEAVSVIGLSRSEHDQYCNLAQFEASVSCSGIGDSSTIDVEDFNMDTIDLSDKKQLIESCVIVEGEELSAFSYRSRRSKSYKKILQDAFMSRKKLTKEYKQLAIWFGDIDQEFSQPAEDSMPRNMGTTPKSPVQELHDSEWELL